MEGSPMDTSWVPQYFLRPHLGYRKRKKNCPKLDKPATQPSMDDLSLKVEEQGRPRTQSVSQKRSSPASTGRTNWPSLQGTPSPTTSDSASIQPGQKPPKQNPSSPPVSWKI